MNIVAHAAATTLVARWLHLEGGDLLLAYVFGILPDLDHVAKVRAYRKTFQQCLQEERKHDELHRRSSLQRCRRLILRHLNNHDFVWRTWIQELTGLLVVFPVSFLLRSRVPLLFFLLHFLMDLVMAYPKRPFWPFASTTVRGWISSFRTEVFATAILVWGVMVVLR
ncbi:MAG: hypothetical protein AAB733_01030 [Patescibacteria group bacterium]